MILADFFAITCKPLVTGGAARHDVTRRPILLRKQIVVGEAGCPHFSSREKLSRMRTKEGRNGRENKGQSIRDIQNVSNFKLLRPCNCSTQATYLHLLYAHWTSPLRPVAEVICTLPLRRRGLETNKYWLLDMRRNTNALPTKEFHGLHRSKASTLIFR